MTNTGQTHGGSGSGDDAALALAMRTSAGAAASEAAWREFDRRHLGHIRSFIEAKASDLGSDEQDDLVIETALRIQRGVEKYVDRGPGKFRSWCLKIADRTVLDARRGRLHLVPGASAGSNELVSFDEIAERYALEDDPGASNPEELLTVISADRELRAPTERERAMREAFALLSDADQAVLWCSIVHGDSDKDVAAITGKPVDHVRKIRHKALGKLQKQFERQLTAQRRAS